MDFLKCMNNFPWNRFATVYETNSKSLKDGFIKMFNGTAEIADYQYVIDRLEHQETLYRITPWGLKFYISLLTEEKTDKDILLENIKVLFEAANYNMQVDIATNYMPTKGNQMKYENIKLKLFDEEFDGTMDADYIKTFKSIDRNFMQISIMDLIQQNCSLIESLATQSESSVSKNASLLINSIRNPKKYEFG
mgnify:CR=1 FL=1